MSCIAGQLPWSLTDLTAVAEAAVAATIESSFSFKAMNLIKLTEALLLSGHSAQGTVVALRAASILRPPVDPMSTAEREKVVEMLARLGRTADAERLLEIDVGSRMRVTLIGNIGAGLATAGNSSGAMERVAAVMSIQPYDGIPVSDLALSQDYALRAIGSALLHAGEVELAREIAGRLSDGDPKAALLAAITSVLSAHERHDLSNGRPAQCDRQVGQIRRLDEEHPPSFAERESLADAMAAAEASGPLVEDARNGLPFLLTLGMGLADRPGGPRSVGEVIGTVSATWRAMRSLPKQSPGPKARAIACIVSEFAAAGRIEDAAKAEVELEVEPRAILQPLRDQALLVLSDAQREIGRPRDAFLNVLRIEDAATRWKPLLKLAAVPACCA